MDYQAVVKQKETWENKPCDHPHLEKEYYSGCFLINYVCTQCGKEFSIPEKLDMDQQRKRMNKVTTRS